MRAAPRLTALALALAGLTVLAPRPITAQARVHALTLDEAIALALEKNERIIVERESVAAADAAIVSARGAYDPLLGLEVDWQRATTPVNSAFSGAPEDAFAPTVEAASAGVVLGQLLPTGGELSLRSSATRETTDGSFDLLSPSHWTRLGIGLQQPLLRGRSVDAARLAVRVAATDRTRAGASLRRELNDTVADVERAYWRLAAVRLAIEVGEEAVRLAEEQLGETSERIASGSAPEKEIAQPRAELERRRGDLIAARETLARAGNALKLLILDDSDSDLWLAQLEPSDPVETEIVDVDVAAAMERALASRAELEAAGAVVERRITETDFARDGKRPSLDLLLAYDRYGLAGSANPSGIAAPGFPNEVPPGLTGGWSQSYEVLGQGDFDDARVALLFGIPIGNRAASGALAVAVSAQRQAEVELAATRKAIRAEVLDAVAGLETAGQRIEAARAARAAAEVQLETERERYAAGMSTNFLVLTRQNDLSSARLDEIAALTNYRMSYAALARATGSLLAERGIDVSAPPANPAS
ncbi:MAG: type secretion outer membrane protein, TolC family [Acidobacteria bacterium]|nr:type secretion outer membrane protein, TolC family [Acidobacteriota bacterium]